MATPPLPPLGKGPPPTPEEVIKTELPKIKDNSLDTITELEGIAKILSKSSTPIAGRSSKSPIAKSRVSESRGFSSSVGDEGGFAPNLKTNEEAIKLIIEAIESSNLKPGVDIHIALDCAASEFFDGKDYILRSENKKLSSSEFINYLEGLVNKYPITSIEDALDENDIDGWKLITEKLGERCQLVGDDLFVTNKNFLIKGIHEKIANSILIKFNQVGTITETIQTIHCANNNKYKSIISHRSGETEDITIADLAVGLGVGQIKTGAPCRSERIAKYNRLLWIENESSNILLNE